MAVPSQLKQNFPTVKFKITGGNGRGKEVIRAGNGPKPQPGQTVTVHCTGFGKDRDLNQKFWSTKDPGQQPLSFKIGQGKVIKGFKTRKLLKVGKKDTSQMGCLPNVKE